MNNLKQKVVGIDKPIQSIQTQLYDNLSKIWNGEIEGYGRIYKNNNSTGEIIPEWYNSITKEYDSVYYDDSKSATFCFLVSDKDNTSDEYAFKAQVKCVFSVNLDKIYSENAERLDAKAESEVVNLFRENYSQTIIKSIEKTIETVYLGYSIEKIKKSDNIQPRHVFSVNFDLIYYFDNQC